MTIKIKACEVLDDSGAKVTDYCGDGCVEHAKEAKAWCDAHGIHTHTHKYTIKETL